MKDSDTNDHERPTTMLTSTKTNEHSGPWNS